MKEILFRAKRKNWRELTKEEWWVEGSYHHQTDYYGDRCDKHYIIDGTMTDTEGYGEHYEIDPETLCQFTGLCDKNGKRIWENDIVNCGTNLRVSWHTFKASWVLSKKGWMYNHFFGEAVEPEDVEVIGNIFDNPELLKGEG